MKKIVTTIDTPLGKMLAQATEHGVSGLWFFGQRYFPADWQDLPADDEAEIFVQLRNELQEYYLSKRKHFTIALTPEGTPYRQKVWKLLMGVTAGSTVSYGDLARAMNAMGAMTSARAVGGAVGHNPISILIPCHRVVGADGGLTGYAGGLERKKALLDIESKMR